jgi:hypothetical protein
VSDGVMWVGWGGWGGFARSSRSNSRVQGGGYGMTKLCGGRGVGGCGLVLG